MHSMFRSEFILPSLEGERLRLREDCLLCLYNLCCAQDNNLSEESTNQAETDVAGDVPNMHKNREQ